MRSIDIYVIDKKRNRDRDKTYISIYAPICILSVKKF